jgi:hypothetical protein
VREYLERRTKESAPPPTPEEIRRQLGWGMLMRSPDDDKMGSRHPPQRHRRTQ